MKFLKVCLLLLISFNIAFSQKQDSKADSIIQVLKTAKEDTTKANRLIALSKRFWQRGDFNKAMSYAKDALSLTEKIDFKRGIVNSYNSIGNIYREQGHYAEALKSHITALKVGMQIGFKKGIAESYSYMGDVYHYQGNYPEAIKNYLASLKIAEEINDIQLISNCYGNLANAYSKENNYSEALKNYLASLKIREKIGDKIRAAYTYVNIGDMYLMMKKWEEAKVYINKGLLLSEQANAKVGEAASYINLGELYLKLQKLTDSKEYLNKALQISKEIRNKEYLKDTYYNLSELDSTGGDFRGAYQYFWLYNKTQDSIQNEESEKQISQLKIQYETEKKDKDIELLNKNNEIKTIKIDKQSATIKYMVGGIILLIFLSLLIFRNQKIAIKNKELIEKLHQQEKLQMKTEIETKEAELERNKTEIKLNKAEIELKRRDLEIKNKEIEYFAIRIAEKKEFIENIEEQIEGLEGTEKDKKSLLKITNIIRNNVIIEKEKFDMENKINESYSGFFSKLENKHPELTRTEKKLCSFIVLNLDTKQIATLSNITTDSVRKGRYLLKRKLYLNSEDDIANYLKSL